MNYQIDLSPDAQKTIRRLPGNVRQRIRRAIQDLAQEPRPPYSKQLDFALEFGEPRRLRLDRWRIIYVIINVNVNLVAVVAIRKRPPYDYTDLDQLFADIFD